MDEVSWVEMILILIDTLVMFYNMVVVLVVIEIEMLVTPVGR